MFNKAVLSNYLNFPFPMFLTSWHMLVATLMTQLLSRTTNRLEGVAKVRHRGYILIFIRRIFLIYALATAMSLQPQNVVQLEHLKTKFLPVAICYAFSLVLSNKAYIYLSVSYLQVCVHLYLAIYLASYLCVHSRSLT
jgi:hypothetical protein